MAEIVLKFSLVTGEAQVETRGFTGNTCSEATRFLTEALGQCTDFQVKAELYEENIERAGCVVSNLCG
jgi:hypothetical protein